MWEAMPVTFFIALSNFLALLFTYLMFGSHKYAAEPFGLLGDRPKLATPTSPPCHFTNFSDGSLTSQVAAQKFHNCIFDLV